MKKNSNFCADESATEPTTKPASEDLNMSAGAEMLIERMKTNPEDFKYGGKFYSVVQALNDGQQWVSKRDRMVLRESYEETIVEADFSEWVYNEIFNPKEEEPVHIRYAQAQAQGQKSQIQSQLAQQMTAIPNGLSSSPGSWTVSTAPPSPPLDPSYIEKLKTKLGL